MAGECVCCQGLLLDAACTSCINKITAYDDTMIYETRGEADWRTEPSWSAGRRGSHPRIHGKSLCQHPAIETTTTP